MKRFLAIMIAVISSMLFVGCVDDSPANSEQGDVTKMYIAIYDDKLEVVENRLKVYAEQSAPLIEYYKQKGVLVTVNGMKSIDEVNAEIEAKLK